MLRIKRYLPYAIGIMVAYKLRPPSEVLGRWFHEIGHGLYQWVGTGFSEFPRIIFFNKYVAAYSPGMGKIFIGRYQARTSIPLWHRLLPPRTDTGNSCMTTPYTMRAILLPAHCLGFYFP